MSGLPWTHSAGGIGTFSPRSRSSIGLPSIIAASVFQYVSCFSFMPTVKAGGFGPFPSFCACRYRDNGLITGHDIATARTVASTEGEPAGNGIDAYLESLGRIAASIARCPPLDWPAMPTWFGLILSSRARAFSHRIA